MTMITPSYLGETIEYSSLHACRSTLEDPTVPTPIVIVAENLDDSEVEISMEALRAGALAAIEKPVQSDARGFVALSAALVNTVRTMADVKVVGRRFDRPVSEKLPLAISRRQAQPAIVAIAASTGGPAALYRILEDIPPEFSLPIVVTQHIAPGFLRGMVRWLSEAGPLRVSIAQDGEALHSGRVYVADDDRHLRLSGDRKIVLSDAPYVDGHRPSASVMFESLAETFGPTGVAVILTGMGRDGSSGLEAVHRAGGIVFAQDEASSVVFGMPGAAIDAGITDLVLPLGAIASRLALATAKSERY